MANAVSHFTFIGCQKPNEQQTTSSYLFRGACLVSGGALLSVGLLVHFKMLSQGIGASYYWMGGGGLALCIGTCIKRVKENAHKTTEPKGKVSEPNKRVSKEFDPEVKALNQRIHSLKEGEYILREQIAEGLLQDGDVDLSPLSERQLEELFRGSETRRSEFLKSMHVRVLNKILGKLDEATLSSIPEEHLLNPEFDWDALKNPKAIFTGHLRGDDFIKQLSEDTLNHLIQIWPGSLILKIVRYRPDAKNLKWENVQNEAILELRPPDPRFVLPQFFLEDFSKLLDCLGLDAICKLLPQMDVSLLKSIPDKYIFEERILMALPADERPYLFKGDVTKLSEVPFVLLNTMIPFLGADTIKKLLSVPYPFTPEHIDFTGLSKDQLEGLFPIQSQREKGETKEVFAKMSNQQLLQIQDKLTPKHIKLFPHRFKDTKKNKP